MKTKTLKLTVHCIITLSLLALLISGCTGSGDKIDKSRPPQIPPESTFIMDFDDFSSSNGVASSAGYSTSLASFVLPGIVSYLDKDEALGDRSNWGYAAFNVGFWNLVGFLGLAIPVASFVESFSHTPKQQSDGSWVWTYDVPVAGVTYTAELHGEYIDNGVRWEMYVTRQNEYTNFLWYYGESNLPATEGYWILKNSPANPTDLLRIDWHRNLSNNTSDIKYTNIVPNSPENGGYISFVTNTGKTYDRSYEIFNKGKNQTTYIEWSSVTGEGRVRDSLHFGDNNWRCWNSQLINSDCP